MNRTSKIILGLAIGATLACALVAMSTLVLVGSAAWALVHWAQTDIAMAGTGAAIAEYSLPPGFGPADVAHVAGFSIISHTGIDGYSHIFLAQLPQALDLDAADVDDQLRQASLRPEIQGMHVVGSRTATIRGQQVRLLVSEGTNHDGQLCRQVVGVFQGENGQVSVLFSAPLAAWDQTAVDGFLASIH